MICGPRNVAPSRQRLYGSRLDYCDIKHFCGGRYLDMFEYILTFGGEGIRGDRCKYHLRCIKVRGVASWLEKGGEEMDFI